MFSLLHFIIGFPFPLSFEDGVYLFGMILDTLEWPRSACRIFTSMMIMYHTNVSFSQRLLDSLNNKFAVNVTCICMQQTRKIHDMKRRKSKKKKRRPCNNCLYVYKETLHSGIITVRMIFYSLLSFIICPISPTLLVLLRCISIATHYGNIYISLIPTGIIE